MNALLDLPADAPALPAATYHGHWHDWHYHPYAWVAYGAPLSCGAYGPYGTFDCNNLWAQDPADQSISFKQANSSSDACGLADTSDDNRTLAMTAPSANSDLQVPLDSTLPQSKKRPCHTSSYSGYGRIKEHAHPRPPLDLKNGSLLFCGTKKNRFFD
jgi:hypothetical protein